VKLIVGLGNPGTRYERTRHNAGFMVLDELAREAQARSWSSVCRSFVCMANLATQPVLLAKPRTFMNASGLAVQLLLAEYGLDAREMIVVLDDVHLPLGRIRIRERGSAGGHHGMESIAGMLNSDEIVRVRLGIGEEYMPEDRAGFVLSAVSPDKELEWHAMIARAAQAVRTMLSDGISRAMSVFNA
jgi:peptidyl-tRNA hydrolase, PTH1 family